MSVSHQHNPTSRRRWVFGFGDRHDAPPEGQSDDRILIVTVHGLNGEGHLLGGTGGQELVVNARYARYASELALRTAFRRDLAQRQQLTGELRINNVPYPACTFVRLVMADRPRPDGKNGLWHVPVVAVWRQRSV